MKKHKKIILWGSKFDTFHTHAFIHHAFLRAAQYLNLDVFWLDNRDNAPEEFFDNAIVISEQWLIINSSSLSATSNRLPLRKSSTYVIHYVGNKGPVEGNPGASMYIDHVGRLIDYRFACDWGINGVEDKNYAYKFEKEKYIKLGNGSAYFEKDKDYDKFYAFWGTDLLPTEINFDNRFIPYDEPKYAFYGGSIAQGWGNAEDGNAHLFQPFVNECNKANIAFYHNDPRRNPISPEILQQAVLRSYIPLDVRPKNHIANNYVPCRSFKNGSYGKLIITNSKAVYNFFDGDVAYASKSDELFHVAREMQDDPKTKDKILNQMKKIKEYNTYVNRLQDIITASEMN